MSINVTKNRNEYPLISVVLPVYNCALYIEEAINSILNQTVQDFEIIIIDDCSVDKTVEIVQSIADNRIKLILKKQNKGLISSLNIGFKNAKGKYIARMDGDDISLPDRFQKQLEILENNPDIKACGCWHKEFGYSNKVIYRKEKHDEIVSGLLVSCSIFLCSAMLDRVWCIDYEFDKTKLHVEDYDFWSKMAWSGKFYNIQEVLYNYRIHDNQITQLYNNIQRQGDVGIKLFLFKKLNYSTTVFSDEMITKMLLLNGNIQIKEFQLFLKWLDELILLNRKSLVYAPVELKKALKFIKRSILFTLYFKKTSIGITKKWRVQALFQLSLLDVLYVLKIKTREVLKTKLLR